MRNTTFWSCESNIVKSEAQGMRAAVIDYKQVQHKACQCDYRTHWLLAAQAAAACAQRTQRARNKRSAALSSSKLNNFQTNRQQLLSNCSIMAEREADERLPHVFGASCSSGCGSLRPYTLFSSALEMRWPPKFERLSTCQWE